MDNLIFWDSAAQNYISLSGTKQNQRASVCVLRMDTEPVVTSLKRSKSTTAAWEPPIPQRVSSMNTRCRKNPRTSRPDLATFHQQSCELFASLDEAMTQPGTDAQLPTYQQSPNESLRSSTSSTPGSDATTLVTKPSSSSSTLSKHQRTYTYSLFPPTSEAWYNTSMKHLALDPKYNPQNMKQRSHSQLSPQITSTEPIFWTSKATREAEYAKIDAAHSGLKGLLKRLAPRSWAWCHGERRNFYAAIEEKVHHYQKGMEDCDVSDTNSVRRYRMSHDEFDVEKSWDQMQQSQNDKPVVQTITIEPGTGDSSDEEAVTSAQELAAVRAANRTELLEKHANDQSTRGRLRKKVSGFFK